MAFGPNTGLYRAPKKYRDIVGIIRTVGPLVGLHLSALGPLK